MTAPAKPPVVREWEPGELEHLAWLEPFRREHNALVADHVRLARLARTQEAILDQWQRDRIETGHDLAEPRSRPTREEWAAAREYACELEAQLSASEAERERLRYMLGEVYRFVPFWIRESLSMDAALSPAAGPEEVE